MAATVTLEVVAGPMKPAKFEYAERTVAIVGRATDCDPQLPDLEPSDALVSRHHCLFDINPPAVRVRDFGSRNGTYVNGTEIGRRPEGSTPQEGARLEFREHDLVDGDRVRMGETVFLVSTSTPVHCAGCGSEIAGASEAAEGGAALCSACSATQQRVGSAAVQPAPSRCAVCGGALDGARGGSDLCGSCHADLEKLVQSLVRKADEEQSLSGIRGYELIRVLGEGGQGIVYLACHQETGEQVALKVLRAEAAVNHVARVEFQREIDCIRSMSHPNVVAFREAGSFGSSYFFTSEYCEGGNVAERMRRHGGTLAIDDAVRITLQALEGLAHMHTASFTSVATNGKPGKVERLVHRDIKPANILLSSTAHDAVAKIGDFGLAKAFDRAGLSGHTMTGAYAGTWPFMSRRQLVDFRCSRPDVDVWSCAASLYCILTGTAPRKFPTPKMKVDPISVILNTNAIPIRQRNPKIPARLANVIDTALVDNPRILIATAAELAHALRDAV